ncbi:MAG: undecaprenyl-phosphate glucose phosphotransferase [Pseudomonadota bacterium]|nr:undecaprenyl-phosphate glucose phosphotransferase [Pseudomonadota bacterium]
MRGLLRGADLVAALTAGVITSAIRFGTPIPPPEVRAALVVVVLLMIVIFPQFGLYARLRGRSIASQAAMLLMALLTVGLLGTGLSFLAHTGGAISRGWVLSWFLLAFVLLMATRSTLTLLLRRLREAGVNVRRLVLVGTGELADQVSARLRSNRWLGLQPVACVALPMRGRRAEDPALAAHALEELPDLVTETGAHEVWIALPITQQAAVPEIIQRLEHSTVCVRMVPDLASLQLLDRPVIDMAGMPVVDLGTSPLALPANRAIKTILGWTTALGIVVLVSPLMFLIAVGVKLSSPGPVLFKQVRHGVNNRPITVYKFRTMRLHEERNGQLVQARRDDDRITPLGRFLRRTSLDELPQFFNVLQGRMSIVGPRPHACQHNDFYRRHVSHYAQRHNVKPGITGWAQVNGWRGETDSMDKMTRRVEHDLYYIQHWSILLDIKIFLMTLLRGFRHTNAY